MLALGLDAVALFIIVLIIQRDALDDTVLILLATVVLWVVNLAIAFLMGDLLGWFVFPVIFVVDSVIFIKFFDMTLARGAIASGVFMVYKILLGVLLYV